MFIADTLSRDCINEDITNQEDELEVFLINKVGSSAMNDLKTSTKIDETLLKLNDIIIEGWPDDVQDVPIPLKPYFNFLDEISSFEEVLFKGQKVIIPSSQKKIVMSQLHAGHQGIQRTLSRAREIVFWINMTEDIQNFVAQCTAYVKVSKEIMKKAA